MRQVAVNIRRARLESGHTQESLARALDVGVRVLQSWEAQGSEQRIPRRGNWEKLCAYHGKHISWFFAEHDDDHPLAA